MVCNGESYTWLCIFMSAKNNVDLQRHWILFPFWVTGLHLNFIIINYVIKKKPPKMDIPKWSKYIYLMKCDPYLSFFIEIVMIWTSRSFGTIRRAWPTTATDHRIRWLFQNIRLHKCLINHTYPLHGNLIHSLFWLSSQEGCPFFFNFKKKSIFLSNNKDAVVLKNMGNILYILLKYILCSCVVRIWCQGEKNKCKQ